MMIDPIRHGRWALMALIALWLATQLWQIRSVFLDF